MVRDAIQEGPATPVRSSGAGVAALGPPAELLARVRWIFLVCNVCSTLALVPLILRGPLAGSASDALVVVGLAGLVWRWRTEHRAGRLGGGWDVLEALFLIGAAAAVGSAVVVLILLYARVCDQALQGDARRVVLVTSSALAAFVAAVVLAPGPGISGLDYAFLASGFPLAAPVMYLIGTTLGGVSRSRERERRLRVATAAITAAADPAAICQAAAAAARDMIATSGWTEARVAAPSDAGWLVTSSAETFPPQHECSLGVDRLGGDVRHLLGTIGVASVHGVAIDLVWTGQPSPRPAEVTMVAFGRRDGRRRGLLMIGSSTPLTDDLHPGLVTLATQVGLALEAATLNAQMHERRNRERLDSLIQHIADVITIVDAAGIIRYASPASTAVVGRTPQMVTGVRLVDLVHPEDRGALDGLHLDGTSTERSAEFRVSDLSGGWRTVEALRGGLGEQDDARGTVLTLRDITDRRRADEALRHSERTFRLLFEANPQPMWVYDADTLRFLAVNQAAISHYGYTRDEFLAMRITDIRPSEDVPALLDSLAGRHTEQSSSGGWRHRRKDGSVIEVDLTSHRQAFDGRPSVLVLAHDVTERNSLESRLRHQALHDPLTGLPNRTLLADRTQQALARGRRHRGKPMMLILDLDDFKTVNDTRGHAAGDRLLVAVADRLRGCLRGTDTPARLGGDEFAVLLEAVNDVGEGMAVAERIIDAMRGPFRDAKHAVQLSCSIGIASWRDDHEGMDDLLRDADIAMYVAKGLGPGRVTLFEPAFRTAVVERAQLNDDLRAAIANGDLHLVYQPEVALPRGNVAVVEALVRWNHPTRGAVTPEQFIPLAEESGLITALDTWVLNEACRQLRRWQEEGLDQLRVAVNMSGRDLDSLDLGERVLDALSGANVEPWQLEIEVTEGTAVRQQPEAVNRLHALRAMGVRIAIDDFGTGYSMLSRLRDLPVDRLKIDRSFVRDLDTDDDSAAIVRASIELGHSLGLSLVAEGVESSSTLAYLLEIGCDAAQGFHICPPVRADELGCWLRQSAPPDLGWSPAAVQRPG